MKSVYFLLSPPNSLAQRGPWYEYVFRLGQTRNREMKSVSFVLSPLSPLARRLRRARPGSVLIIVIVLLLLLAILGAAYISTTRSARVSSAQNVLSSDVDAVMNGVAKICEGVISDDLNDPFNNLHGNSSLPTAPASGNPVINRGLSQGEGAGTVGGAPAITPTNGAYNIGDIVTTTDHPNLFLYYFNSRKQQRVGSRHADRFPTPPNANGTPSNGWQLMTGYFFGHGHLHRLLGSRTGFQDPSRDGRTAFGAIDHPDHRIQFRWYDDPPFNTWNAL